MFYFHLVKADFMLFSKFFPNLLKRTFLTTWLPSIPSVTLIKLEKSSHSSIRKLSLKAIHFNQTVQWVEKTRTDKDYFRVWLCACCFRVQTSFGCKFPLVLPFFFLAKRLNLEIEILTNFYNQKFIWFFVKIDRWSIVAKKGCNKVWLPAKVRKPTESLTNCLQNPLG